MVDQQLHVGLDLRRLPSAFAARSACRCCPASATRTGQASEACGCRCAAASSDRRASKDIPFVARHARPIAREDVLAGLDVPADRPLALSSFGGYGVNGSRRRAAATASRSTGRSSSSPTAARPSPNRLPTGGARSSALPMRRIYDAGIRYEDLVAAADVVVTKPDTASSRNASPTRPRCSTPPRGHFPEYDVLVAAKCRGTCGARSSTRTSLLAGRWRDAARRAAGAAAADRASRTNGAEVAADVC